MIFMMHRGASTFHPQDNFVGYQSDTPASIVFKVCQVFKGTDDDKWKEKVHMYVSLHHLSVDLNQTGCTT